MEKIILVFLLLCTMESRAGSTVVACGNKEYQKADEQLSSVVKGLKNSKKPWLELQSVFKVWEPCKSKFQDNVAVSYWRIDTSKRGNKVSPSSA
ncbi:hypothetical protein EZJ49_09230 [Bdellovibrio bacteriovorus]|uniref:hypothetical protein n=1 Tax=Bdellovibrio bacteriovorus TaxID=959 RepID=UPI0021CEE9B0|nr:hypothetical protein [Bdellovibrio bacteriovorus]UXR63260.1 hypothetical protein EZJ49_09230 [Bdellovibrio bacteriovorus]